MKLIPKIAICSLVAAAVIAGSAYAESKLSLYINDIPYVPTVLGLKVEDGKVLAPIELIAKEFRGSASYDSQSQEVRVTLPDAARLAIQVSRLQDGLLADTPEEALNTWIKGIRTRNGALQYAVFSPELKERTKSEFESFYWVTGGSSPHMGAIENLESSAPDEDTVQYSFDYRVVATEYDEQGSAVVTIQKFKQTPDLGEGWYITRIGMKDPGDTGITIGVEPLEQP
ncbi:hypothetical protein [Paenibacillus sp. OAS669]|uniref:hypothetical protein n=1 Tax=Paenibacillus sp. OAS669 TaxID=2663821 RepID=UPI0017893874|nr:hypothetical protein [Paenibacillus sp. OAS669]MBE1446646.1 hypothetical protein [Paenibacillus sp. OAS669]